MFSDGDLPPFLDGRPSKYVTSTDMGETMLPGPHLSWPGQLAVLAKLVAQAKL